LLISCVIKDKEEEEEEEEGDDYKDMGEEDEPMKDDDRQSDPLFPEPLKVCFFYFCPVCYNPNPNTINDTKR
jgi:hypothetical protein